MCSQSQGFHFHHQKVWWPGSQLNIFESLESPDRFPSEHFWVLGWSPLSCCPCAQSLLTTHERLGRWKAPSQFVFPPCFSHSRSLWKRPPSVSQRRRCRRRAGTYRWGEGRRRSSRATWSTPGWWRRRWQRRSRKGRWWRGRGRWWKPSWLSHFSASCERMWSGGSRLKQSTETCCWRTSVGWQRNGAPSSPRWRRSTKKESENLSHKSRTSKFSGKIRSQFRILLVSNTHIVKWVEAFAIAIVLPALLYAGVEYQGDCGEKGETPTDDDNSRPPESREHENDVVPMLLAGQWSPVSLKWNLEFKGSLDRIQSLQHQPWKQNYEQFFLLMTCIFTTLT